MVDKQLFEIISQSCSQLLMLLIKKWKTENILYTIKLNDKCMLQNAAPNVFLL